ncbi:MAG: DUF4145 domain-containing protein [Patescibacteria group bacterium]
MNRNEYKITNGECYANPDNCMGTNIISGICPWCNQSSGFKISGKKSEGTIPLICDTCRKHIIYDVYKRFVFPLATLEALNDLPNEIDKYYQEALRCISVEAPNGAATLFRKIIHQVGILYGVAKPNDKTSIMGIVEKIEKDGHINNKLVEALRRVKDLGNDGAHINKNEPNFEQIHIVKNLIDNFLQATVLQDNNIALLDNLKKGVKSDSIEE